MKRRGVFSIQLALAAGNAPPSEFLISKAGWNETAKGPYLFDAIAARDVMAAFDKAGVDGMIDLQHLSLDDWAPNYDPDARGWFKLALRGGDLWAVDVRWTPDGDRRLRELAQRYISPCIIFDEKTGRVVELYNVAICAIPATYEAPPLMAASRGGRKQRLTTETVPMDKIAEALGLPTDATLEQILDAIATLQKSDDGDAPAALTDDEKGTDDEKLAKALAKAPKMFGRLMAKLSTSEDTAARLVRLEQSQKQTAVQQLVSANAKKLTKAQEKWALTQSVEVLTSFFEHAPEVNHEPAIPPAGGGGGGPGVSDIKLTDDDLVSAKRLGKTPEQFLDAKKKIYADQKARLNS